MKESVDVIYRKNNLLLTASKSVKIFSLLSARNFSFRALSISRYVEFFLKLPQYQVRVHLCNCIMFYLSKIFILCTNSFAGNVSRSVKMQCKLAVYQ